MPKNIKIKKGGKGENKVPEESGLEYEWYENEGASYKDLEVEKGLMNTIREEAQKMAERLNEIVLVEQEAA